VKEDEKPLGFGRCRSQAVAQLGEVAGADRPRLPLANVIGHVADVSVAGIAAEQRPDGKQLITDIDLPDPRDQPIAYTFRIFVIASELFSEGSLLDLNTNREQTKQYTSPEESPPGAKKQRCAE
jgi:hypothetical protein